MDRGMDVDYRSVQRKYNGEMSLRNHCVIVTAALSSRHRTLSLFHRDAHIVNSSMS